MRKILPPHELVTWASHAMQSLHVKLGERVMLSNMKKRLHKSKLWRRIQHNDISADTSDICGREKLSD